MPYMQDRKPARQGAPAVTIRFRTKKELDSIRRAAKVEGLSLNTFVCGKAAVAAADVLAAEQRKQPQTSEPMEASA